jgi:hypothetical protein
MGFLKTWNITLFQVQLLGEKMAKRGGNPDPETAMSQAFSCIIFNQLF